VWTVFTFKNKSTVSGVIYSSTILVYEIYFTHPPFQPIHTSYDAHPTHLSYPTHSILPTDCYVAHLIHPIPTQIAHHSMPLSSQVNRDSNNSMGFVVSLVQDLYIFNCQNHLTLASVINFTFLNPAYFTVCVCCSPAHHSQVQVLHRDKNIPIVESLR